jgi:iron complex transport system permease protein
MSIAMAAILGAGVASLVIMGASRKFRSATALLVFGVMLSFIANAIVTVLQSGSNAENLKIFHSWSAGSFATTSMKGIVTISIVLLIGSGLAVINAKGLDIILFGDEFARLSGAKPHRIRLLALLSCCMITGILTAYCGPIGFVGIVAPHVARALWKTSVHKHILPASFLCGAITGITADLFSQITSSPIPISSTMALVGIPVILYILLKRPEYR